MYIQENKLKASKKEALLKKMPKSLRAQEDKESTLKKELEKAYERIGVLETRVGDLTLQLAKVSKYKNTFCGRNTQLILRIKSSRCSFFLMFNWSTVKSNCYLLGFSNYYNIVILGIRQSQKKVSGWNFSKIISYYNILFKLNMNLLDALELICFIVHKSL